MKSTRTLTVALAAAVALSACGGSGTSDEPAPTEPRFGESAGIADAIDTSRQVAEEAEQRATSIDQLAP